jgi:hypothetical protein
MDIRRITNSWTGGVGNREEDATSEIRPGSLAALRVLKGAM